MEKAAHRPFYDEYAWAYDLIIPPPRPEQYDFIADTLTRRGVAAGSLILDAGCGVGSHAVGLSRRGYEVRGIDASARLIAEALKRAAEFWLPVAFEVSDILELGATPKYDGILCRGVLNDFADERSREEIFHSFARALRHGGALVLDVREWEGTVRRKTREPVFEKTVETPRGSLTFRSTTRLEPRSRGLLVSERHTLREGPAEAVSVFDFRMQCWTRDELQGRLTGAGFGNAEYFGAYDLTTAAGTSDRLVCVASRG